MKESTPTGVGEWKKGMKERKNDEKDFEVS
jgi:hypothetical protein